MQIVDSHLSIILKKKFPLAIMIVKGDANRKESWRIPTRQTHSTLKAKRKHYMFSSVQKEIYCSFHTSFIYRK